MTDTNESLIEQLKADLEKAEEALGVKRAPRVVADTNPAETPERVLTPGDVVPVASESLAYVTVEAETNPPTVVKSPDTLSNEPRPTDAPPPFEPKQTIANLTAPPLGTRPVSGPVPGNFGSVIRREEDRHWMVPNPLIGSIVRYVMPDLTEREALILTLNKDGVANLNVAVALNSNEPIQRQQFGAVPHGAAGQALTWHEADQ